MGRHSMFTPEMGKTICSRLMGGEALTVICKDEGMPDATTVCDWLASALKPNAKPWQVQFLEDYRAARQIQAEMQIDEIIKIADDATNDYVERTINGQQVRVLDHEHVQRSKLRIETRMWRAERLLPRVYGAKTQDISENKAPAPLTIVVQPQQQAITKQHEIIDVETAGGDNATTAITI